MNRLVAVSRGFAVLFLVALLPVLSMGCASLDTAAAKRVTERVCSLSEGERGLVREKMDAATYPRSLRVECGE